MVRRFADYILKTPLHAGWIAMVCAALSIALPPVAWLGFIILGFVTLRLGAKTAAAVLCWMLLPGVILAILKQPSWLANFAVNGALVVMFGSILRRYSSWGYVLEVASLIGMMGILAAHGLVDDLTQWWVTQLQGQLQNSNIASEFGLSPAEVASLINKTARLATGFWAVLLLLSSALELLIARWWQAALYNPGGLRREFQQIRISRWLTVLLVLCIIAVLLRYFVFADLLPVIALPFLFGGLSLMHFVADSRKLNVFVLAAVYVLLFLFPQLVVSVLVMLSFADSWINLRPRWAKSI